MSKEPASRGVIVWRLMVVGVLITAWVIAEAWRSAQDD